VGRTIPIAIAAASFVGIVVSGWFMVHRVRDFNATSSRKTFAFQDVLARNFEYAGHPVSITDETDDKTGWVFAHIRYGDESLRLRASLKVDESLPDLAAHRRWLKVLRFAEAEGVGIDELNRRILAGEVPDRLVIVTREPRPGADPETWGEVQRADWRFSFYELLPDGTIAEEHRAYPETERSLNRRRSQARREGLPVPERNPNEIFEGTWQFQAALALIPEGMGPKLRFDRDGVRAMGWTLPVASVSMLTFVFSLGFAMAPRRRTA
jgi:hypothetical protein